MSAEIKLYADTALLETLSKLGDELRFVTITSKADLFPLEDGAGANGTSMPGLRVSLSQSPAKKCVRCWHFIDNVGTNIAHPDICNRCIDNISGKGEIRRYA